MSNYNNKVLEMTGVKAFHDKGYKGQGIKVAMWDSRNSSHCPMHPEVVHDIERQFAPDAETKVFVFNGVREGVEACLEWGADIVNISMVGIDMDLFREFRSEYEGDMYEEFFERCFVVASSGNSGEEEYKYPAATEKYKDKCLAVGACFINNAGDVGITSYSTYNDRVDIANFTNINPTKDYTYNGITFPKTKAFTGTSCSAPVTSGQIACYMSMFKDVFGRKPSISEVNEYIYNHCVDIVGTKDGHGYPVLEEIKVEKEIRIKVPYGQESYYKRTITGYDGAKTYKEIINGKANEKEFTDSEGKEILPFIIATVDNVNTPDAMYAPVRWLAETIGMKVEWDDNTKEVVLKF